MSQENKDKTKVAEERTRQTKGFMQQVRAASRRKYTPEEKGGHLGHFNDLKVPITAKQKFNMRIFA